MGCLEMGWLQTTVDGYVVSVSERSGAAYQNLCPRTYYAPTTLAQSIDLHGSFCSIIMEEVARTA